MRFYRLFFGSILLAIILFNCGTDNENICAPVNWPSSSTAAIPVKLFLEGSYSMRGYVNQTGTTYKKAMAEIMGQIEDEKVSPSYYIITDSVYPIPTPSNPIKFLQQLTPGSPLMNKGNIYASDYNAMVDKLLNTTRGDTMAILITDGIYSGLTGDLIKSGMKSMLSKRLKKDTSTTTAIIQMKSDFWGDYVFEENDTKKLTGDQRPYYIWIIGPRKQALAFLEKNKPAKWPGYKNSFVLGINGSPTYYSLTTLGQQGRYTITCADGKTPCLTNAEPTDGLFRFSLAADLALPGVDSLYKQDTHNYVVSNPAFRVVSVSPIGSYSSNDPSQQTELASLLKANKRLTHLISVEAKENFPDETYTISLLSSIPEWVSKSHTDTLKNGILPGKTFNLEPLLGGVAAAYAQQQYISSFSVTIYKD